jgi:hypothetical protein
VRPCRLSLFCCLTTEVTTDMSTTESKHGKVDGRSVIWRYQRTENDQVGNFSWAEEDGKVACKYKALLDVARLADCILTMIKRKPPRRRQ